MYFGDFFMMMVNLFLVVLVILLSVAFLTLFERSVLGYLHFRSGPNSVGMVGLLQPFGDAIKLFLSEQPIPLLSNFIFYYISPILGLFLSLLIWLVVPYLTFFSSFSLGFLFFICVSGLGVYAMMFAGWSSNSNYALLGSLRAVAQVLSYEVSLALILLSLFLLVGSYDMSGFYIYQSVWFILVAFPLFISFYCSCLAETNRSPFDFAEGESELVSGFNVEFGSGGFALIFMSEYLGIIFMGLLICLVFLGGNYWGLSFFIKVVLVSFSFLWVRGTLPRYRYDKLMSLAWSVFLPVSLNYFLFFMGLKLYLL
nr:NADH dehydrogenase subunit 1 [Tripetaloceroides tonkinensis]